MRQGIFTSFMLIFAVFLLIQCASADEIVIQQDNVKVSVENCVPGRWYTFLASEDLGTEEITFSADSLLYIDQLQADASGVISILFLHSDLPECNFLLGGVFEEHTSPRIIGHYIPDNGGSDLPGALQIIGEEAFAGSGFSSIILGNVVTTIEARAFADCENLRRVVIPMSVEQIAPDAFDGCKSLTIACPPDSAAFDFAVANGYTVDIIQ